MLGSWHGVDSVSPLPVGASGGMADALASGASVRKDVGVQVPPRAPTAGRSTSRFIGGVALTESVHRETDIRKVVVAVSTTPCQAV